MKKLSCLLLFICTLIVAFAFTPDNKTKKEKKQEKSSCCSYEEFASKNKRVKKTTATNDCNKSIRK